MKQRGGGPGGWSEGGNRGELESRHCTSTDPQPLHSVLASKCVKIVWVRANGGCHCVGVHGSRLAHDQPRGFWWDSASALGASALASRAHQRCDAAPRSPPPSAQLGSSLEPCGSGLESESLSQTVSSFLRRSWPRGLCMELHDSRNASLCGAARLNPCRQLACRTPHLSPVGGALPCSGSRPPPPRCCPWALDSTLSLRTRDVQGAWASVACLPAPWRPVVSHPGPTASPGR